MSVYNCILTSVIWNEINAFKQHYIAMFCLCFCTKSSLIFSDKKNDLSNVLNIKRSFRISIQICLKFPTF